MDARDMFPPSAGSAMKAAEFEGSAVVTIEGFSSKEYDDGTTWYVHFSDHEQVLPLNKTRNDELRLMFGNETDDWIGKQIQISRGKTKYKGDTVATLVVEAPSEPAAPRAVVLSAVDSAKLRTELITLIEASPPEGKKGVRDRLNEKVATMALMDAVACTRKFETHFGEPLDNGEGVPF